MKQYKDGWHKIAGYEVYMEDGYIIRGMTGNGTKQRTTFIYRASRNECWDLIERIRPDAFRAGVKRGTVKMD